MDNLFLSFQGFHPSEFTRSYLNEKMNTLYDEAPSSSTLKAKFTREGPTFKGVITIYSSAGKFFAVASGSKLKEVTHKLVEQIRRQLDRWKTQRFERRDMKNIKNWNTKEVDHDTDDMASVGS